ncbi:MAG: hypothetical protein EPN34_06090 [Burkholderiaceae bacterium]|nr:MAG: hypothetical protein EPN34_06090 [Burkholderiaceae bacterium]
MLQFRGGAAENIDMMFYRRTGHQVTYVDTTPALGAPPVAKWKDSAGTLYVIERSELIQDREAYDENELQAQFKLDQTNVIVSDKIQPFSTIDAIVASFKYLLHKTYTIPVGAQYAFARIRLLRSFEGSFQISYTRHMGQFVQGDIHSYDIDLGQIFFGIWK